MFVCPVYPREQEFVEVGGQVFDKIQAVIDLLRGASVCVGGGGWVWVCVCLKGGKLLQRKRERERKKMIN